MRWRGRGSTVSSVYTSACSCVCFNRMLDGYVQYQCSKIDPDLNLEPNPDSSVDPDSRLCIFDVFPLNTLYHNIIIRYIHIFFYCTFCLYCMSLPTFLASLLTNCPILQKHFLYLNLFKSKLIFFAIISRFYTLNACFRFSLFPV